jgi:hypothetical protein
VVVVEVNGYTIDPDVRGIDFDLFEVQIQGPIQAEMI